MAISSTPFSPPQKRRWGMAEIADALIFCTLIVCIAWRLRDVLDFLKEMLP